MSKRRYGPTSFGAGKCSGIGRVRFKQGPPPLIISNTPTPPSLLLPGKKEVREAETVGKGSYWKLRPYVIVIFIPFIAVECENIGPGAIN